MRFIIDGTECNFPHTDSLSRKDLLDVLYDKVALDGRVIVDMFCGSKSLDDEDFLTLPDASVVEVHTVPTNNAGNKMLDDIENRLQKIFQKLQSLLNNTMPFMDSMLDVIYKDLDSINYEVETVRHAYSEHKGALPDIASLKKEIAGFGNLLREGNYKKAHAWYVQHWGKKRP